MSKQGKAAQAKREKGSDTGAMLKVSQVSRATGVSTSAINYYVRIGLLPPPLKTHKNMAYYDPSYIQMINYIKRLQMQRRLPLERIREIMAKKTKIWREIGSGSPGTAEEFFASDLSEDVAGMRDVRRRVIEAGMLLFSRQGYFTTTEADVMSQAEVSAGQFYEHYAGKEDLLLDIAEEAVRVFRQRIADRIQAVPDMLERIRLAIPVTFQSIVENREIYTLYLEESVLSDVSYERKVMQITASISKDLKATIARGVKDGSIRRVHPDIAANAIIGQLVRLVNYWVEDPMRHNMEEITRETVEFTTRALRP